MDRAGICHGTYRVVHDQLGSDCMERTVNMSLHCSQSTSPAPDVDLLCYLYPLLLNYWGIFLLLVAWDEDLDDIMSFATMSEM